MNIRNTKKQKKIRNKGFPYKKLRKSENRTTKENKDQNETKNN